MDGHIPVLKENVLDVFSNTTGTLLDGTFGGGGHTEALLLQNSHLKITALDIDPAARERAQILQKKFEERLAFFPINFSQTNELNQTFDGVLLDLGVSSFQLDNPLRGFSFMREGPLDMRMNPTAGLSAKDFLRTASQEQLVQAIRDYGEEPLWKPIVRCILEARATTSWDTTTQFVDFLLKNTPINRSKKQGLHPATRVFQGIRIAVNDELNHLSRGLTTTFDALNKGGILAVISFHSLEDRIVKKHFYNWCGRSTNKFDAQPKQLRTVVAELLSRKPIIASPEEIAVNPRSRSAKLRILKKL